NRDRQRRRSPRMERPRRPTHSNAPRRRRRRCRRSTQGHHGARAREVRDERRRGIQERACPASDCGFRTPQSMIHMPYSHLLISTSAAGVRTITLNRPDRLNAVNPQLADELPRAVDDAATDDAVRVVVITGAGRGFCSGLDLSEPPRLPDGDLRQRLDDLAWVGRWVLAVTRCEKPVIAAVNGAAA